ncbi:MAG: type III-B CRISPR module RAMP protein Cmr6 [Bacteroidales bacterium]|nr:type III-B CRISPR module RAMP protein Cmr6 [Bacteroidales bacterium]
MWGDAEEQFRKGQSYHRLLFGTTDESGCLIFHDAWFVPDSETNPLQRDVMTPHHPQWLDGSAPPTDFDSPVPVPFLSIAGQFQIAVSWCGPTEKEWKWFWELGAACLRQALFDWGIGGKTTSGYGRFNEERWRITEDQRLKEAERKRIAAEKEATLAAMSPLERNIQELLENHPNKSEKREWPKLLEELKKSDGRFSTPEDRRAVAQRIKAGMQESGAWKDKGKDGERKKIIQNILGES